MANKRSYLEMVQGIINRLSHNSFLLKGWTVVLVTGLFVLSKNDNDKVYFVLLAYIPVISFWGLDAYFLRQERLYRKLYDRVRSIKNDDVDFSMDTSLVKKEVDDWYKTVFF